MINPNNTIDGIPKTFGGMFFKFKSNETIGINEYPFHIFAWFPHFFDSIIHSDKFDQISTIELDRTFEALDPYVLCIPQMIYRNTGIPMAILVSISEKSSLYSLFF